VAVEPLSGPGSGATCLHTAHFKLEAIGFEEVAHFVWLTSAGPNMRAELVALADAVHARLHP
jgi:hypothetical protein